VNFGTIHTLRVERTIETFGCGARGFNGYDGVMDTAEFERIVTYADAGVGVQVSRPVARLIVHKGITTHGGLGQTLVKGVIVQLPAYGLSVQPGGVVDEVIIDRGGIVTKGDNVISLQVQGKIGALRVRDGIHAAGYGSDAAHVEGGSVSLEGLALTATDGCALRLKDATLTALPATNARGVSGDVVVESNSQVITDARSVDELTGAFGNAFTVLGSATLQLHG
jgi:hypothetical protein